MERNCGALCNIVVISMRACDRGKSEALVHAELKGFPAGTGLWYMGTPRVNNVILALQHVDAQPVCRFKVAPCPVFQPIAHFCFAIFSAEHGNVLPDLLLDLRVTDLPVCLAVVEIQARAVVEHRQMRGASWSNRVGFP